MTFMNYRKPSNLRQTRSFRHPAKFPYQRGLLYSFSKEERCYIKHRYQNTGMQRPPHGRGRRSR